MLDLALVLTAKPGASAIQHAHVAGIWSRLPARCRLESEWLGRGEAWQARLSVDDERAADAVRSIAGDVLAGLPIDINLCAGQGSLRRKRLLVADMESTIIEEECLDELSEFAGLREQVSGITERAMQGEIEFEAALRERAGLLQGLPTRVLDEVYERRVTLAPGALTLVRTMKKHGAACALVSGGFTFFSERIAERLGFDVHQANRLEIVDGKLTGRVAEPILAGEAKLAALEREAAARAIPMSETAAVGDGANDLAMIRAAGLGVAFRAKPKVVTETRRLANGAVITHGDLTALLYLQGYRRTEFAG